METNWKFLTVVYENDDYLIHGLSFWSCLLKTTGERVSVKDPLYGQSHKMKIFEIEHEGTMTRYAAGEFSNCVWGLYEEV